MYQQQQQQQENKVWGLTNNTRFTWFYQLFFVKKSISPENQISREIQKTSIKLFEKCSLHNFPSIDQKTEKTQPKKVWKRIKGKGRGEERPKTARGRHGHTTTTHWARLTLPLALFKAGEGRDTHTHKFFFYFLFLLVGFFPSFFCCCSAVQLRLRPFPHARASSVGRWVGWCGPPFYRLREFSADRIGSPDRIPSSFSFFYYLFTNLFFLGCCWCCCWLPHLVRLCRPPPRLCPFLYKRERKKNENFAGKRFKFDLKEEEKKEEKFGGFDYFRATHVKK